jgi:hypothetical protein
LKSAVLRLAEPETEPGVVVGLRFDVRDGVSIAADGQLRLKSRQSQSAINDGP